MSEDIHSCSVFCARTACVSARECDLRSQRAGLADLLDQCTAALHNLDDSGCHDWLIAQGQAAVRAVRMDGVDIDAAHGNAA